MTGHSILLVDDDESILETLKDIFWMEGYEVSTVNNGKSAHKFIGAKYFDLVITDLKMKEINGLDVLKKSKEVFPECGVIIHTAYANLPSAIDALRTGADDYLQKPCSPKELIFRVKKCIEKYEVIRKMKSFDDILPVCCKCKKIRDDSKTEYGTGEWINLEKYLSLKTNARISHGYCESCLQEEMKKVNSDQNDRLGE